MRRRRNGQALIYVGIFLLAFLSLAALVVDGARLYFSARETQAAADAAAIGGTLSLIEHGSVTDAVAGAQQSANLNTVNGQSAAIDSGEAVGPNGTSHIAVGRWCCDTPGCTPTFTPGGTPLNAVRTTPTYPISNLVPLWQSVSHPRRGATAAWLNLGKGIPGIPLVLAYCFTCTSADCTPQPKEITFSAGGTGGSDSAWYYPSYSTCSPNCGAKDVEAYVPTGCGGGGKVGPALGIGSTVNVDNGGKTSVCKDFECLIGKKYLTTIVGKGCGQVYVGTDKVTGFATVKILGTYCGSSQLGDAPVQKNAIKAQVAFIDCAKEANQSICSSQYTCDCDACGTGRVLMVE